MDKKQHMERACEMGYLEEFKVLVNGNNLTQFFKIWEEYCLSDQLDGEELAQILQVIKESPIAPSFGQFSDTALALWQKIEDQEIADRVLAHILDLQPSNNTMYADLAINLLQRRYGTHPQFTEMLRIVGLRQKQNFKGAISNFELLMHLGKGKFVFHTGGWGVGEIIDFSLLREHLSVEFEGISTVKDLAFSSIFGSLIPLSSDHFLARRFGNPDLLEKEGKEDPVKLIALLLRDLGPKTAADIKEEVCELIIPEEDWTKWWQNTRVKLKKDTHIQSPKSAKEPFSLRKEALGHDKQLLQALEKIKNADELIITSYNFMRDFPDVIKNSELKTRLKKQLTTTLDLSLEETSTIEEARQLQLSLLLEDIAPEEYKHAVENLCRKIKNLEEVINRIEIVAFKKRVLMAIRKTDENWATHFLHLLFTIEQNTLRDYILKELLLDQHTKELVRQKLHDLLHKMTLFPETFFWYFQKILSQKDFPHSDVESRRLFLEAFCILLHFVENDEKHKELGKKMYQFLCAKRYLVVREIIEGASIAYLKEFLLLASKCYSFSKQDIRILQSLCEVVQPDMKKEESKEIEEIIWTTAEGYQKLQERIQRLGTVEMIENAREIEEARAYGDLRENSEYKFALERRSRLQSELQQLSKQLNIARILTPADIDTKHVSHGTVVLLENSKKQLITYILLGPWDADIEKNILSSQSKLAEKMMGLKIGEKFEFQNEKFTILKIESFLS